MRPHPLHLAILLLALPAVVAAAAPPANLAGALETQLRLAADRPGDAAVHNDLGNLLALAGAWEDAEEAYRRAIQIAPEESAGRYNLALLEIQRGHRRKALDLLRRVLRHDPENAWAHYQAGALLERDGQRKRAIHHYARAVALDPQLTRPEINPHVVDNELMISAVLTAQGSRPPLAAPPEFHEPARIAGLLVARPRGEAEAAGEPAPPAAETGAPDAPPPAQAAPPPPAAAAPAPPAPPPPKAKPEAEKTERRRRAKPPRQKPAEAPPPPPPR